MEHQPFETWIIDEIKLTSEQREALEAHTQECPQCRKLQLAWSQVLERIEAAPAAVPAPGFSQRFQASLEERRLHQQQIQIRRLGLFLVVGAALSFFAWVAILLFSASPADLLVSGFQTFTQLFVSYDILQRGIVSILNSVPLIIPLALWIAITCSFVFLTVVWAISVWRISFQGVYKK